MADHFALQCSEVGPGAFLAGAREPDALGSALAEYRPPRFSVVVPAYNEAELLPATLSSLRAQRHPSFEIIVVDNNSTDATAEIARSGGATVVFEPVPGVCQARQCGTAAARGEIVVSADADTVYSPNWLARIDEVFASDDDVVAVAGPCRYVDPPWWMDLFSRGLFATVDHVSRATGWVGYVSATNIAFRRSAFSGYDLTLTQGGDELDVLRRLRRQGRVVWDHTNVATTSPRRLSRGLVHTLFVSLILHYLLGYALNRVFRRTVLGMAPAVRGGVAAGRRPFGDIRALDPRPGDELEKTPAVASPVAIGAAPRGR